MQASLSMLENLSEPFASRAVFQTHILSTLGMIFNILRLKKGFWTNLLLLSGLCGFLAHDDLSFVEVKHETWLSNGPKIGCSRDQVGNDLPPRQSAWRPSSVHGKLLSIRTIGWHCWHWKSSRFLKKEIGFTEWRGGYNACTSEGRHHFIRPILLE